MDEIIKFLKEQKKEAELTGSKYVYTGKFTIEQTNIIIKALIGSKIIIDSNKLPNFLTNKKK